MITTANQIVDHRELEQEGAQRRGQVRPDQREHGQRERDVRRCRDRPTRQRIDDPKFTTM